VKNMDKTKSLDLRIGAFVRFGANTKLTQIDHMRKT
jgi:hypothetical protein